LIVGFLFLGNSHLVHITFLPSIMDAKDLKPSSADLKATAAELDAMIYHTELLDRQESALSSRAPSASSEGQVPLDNATLAQAIATAVTSALRLTQQGSPLPSPPQPLPRRESTLVLADMTLRKSPRSPVEINLGRIQVARTARGDTVEARRKIRDRSCVAIEPKFTAMDFSRLITHNSSEDLGTMVLAQQTMLDKFRSWCQQVDVAYIFRVPSLSDFQDHQAVASAPRVDLLTSYKTIPLWAVLQYQSFVNEWRSDVDVESCDWALQVLELSIVPTLLVQIKQSFDILPKTQQGGLTLFKLLMDKLDAKTFENTKLLQEYITSFRLDRIPGENVSMGSSCFKAAAKMLSRPDLPTDLLQHYLRGMSACHNEEFRSICSSQLGFLSTPMYEEWSLVKAQDILVQLDVFASKLETKYEALKASKSWAGTTRPDSTFKAASAESSPSPRHTAPQAPNPSWQRWFDSKTCGICGKPHPTKYHDNPGIWNRPYAPKASTSQRLGTKSQVPHRSTESTGPRFKKGGKDKFLRSVHQALLDNAEEVDENILANLAGSFSASTGDNLVNLAGSFPASADDDEPPQDAEELNGESALGSDSAPDDSDAQALAAIGLDQLLNW
jgi:hypothetical protein